MVEIINKQTQNEINLPPEASYTDGKLLWNDKHVCSFRPRVHSIVDAEIDGEINTLVKVSCVFADGSESAMKSFPLLELKSIDWLSLDLKCQLNPDCSKAGTYLAAIIQHALPDVEKNKEYYVNRLGLHMIEDVPVFCVGDRLIRSPAHEQSSEINIELEELPNKLAIDTMRYSELQAVQGMMKLINLSPSAGKVIFAHTLLSIMRVLYTNAGVIPSCIVYLVGVTSTKKTTYSAFMTQLYDRDKGIQRPTRLNGSIPGSETLLHDKVDCVVILDDLFPAKGQTKLHQEKTLVELVRIIGDNSGRVIMRGNEVVSKEPQCGVITTGEYLFGTGSDAARLLPIKFEPINNIKLAECQKEPLVVSTFYHYFIAWFISNYHSIQTWVAESLIDSRKTNLGVVDRLQETHFCLSSAYRIFLRYCIEKGFTTPYNARTQDSLFKNQLLALIKEQHKRTEMNSDDKSENVDYLGLIKALYSGKVFRLAESMNKLKGKPHGLIYDGHLCLRGKKLMDELLRYFPKATLKDVGDSLLAKKALKIVGDKRSIQISGGGGIRFYAIPLKKLK